MDPCLVSAFPLYRKIYNHAVVHKMMLLQCVLLRGALQILYHACSLGIGAVLLSGVTVETMTSGSNLCLWLCSPPFAAQESIHQCFVSIRTSVQTL